MTNLIAAIVNLLTLISTAIINAVNRERVQNETTQRQDEVERLNENPGQYIADMFGTRGSDGMRSDTEANEALYRSRQARYPDRGNG